jgi:hypothetical protein
MTPRPRRWGRRDSERDSCGRCGRPANWLRLRLGLRACIRCAGECRVPGYNGSRFAPKAVGREMWRCAGPPSARAPSDNRPAVNPLDDRFGDTQDDVTSAGAARGPWPIFNTPGSSRKIRVMVSPTQVPSLGNLVEAVVDARVPDVQVASATRRT